MSAPRRKAFGRRGGEAGFTLVELMITVALLGIGLAYIVTIFMKSWEVWKRSWTDIWVQHNGRVVMDRISQAVRQAKPMTVTIDNETGEAWYSRINFTHVREEYWVIWKKGDKLYTSVNGTTSYLCDGVEAMQFTYPDFGDYQLIDAGLTLNKRTGIRAGEIRVQLTERIGLRNP